MYSQLLSSIFLATLLAFAPPLVSLRNPQSPEDPKVIETKAPIYPAIARSLHLQGSVVLEVAIDADGKVTSVSAITGHPILYNASKGAALGWRFEAAPGGANNRQVRLTFEFNADRIGCNQVSVVGPYHLRISPEPPSDTVSYVPDNAEAMHCKVHRTKLLRDKVGISYGLIGFQKGYWKAEQKLFPEANSTVYGGCLVEAITCENKEIQLSPQYAEVLYCPVCRKAQAEWSRQHSHNPVQP
jgi:TonB family protein